MQEKMTSSYRYGGPSIQSTRNHFREPPSVLARMKDTVSSVTSPYLRRAEVFISEKTGRKVQLGFGGRDWRRFLTFANVVTFFWIVLLYRGERSAFKDSIGKCSWQYWENWVRLTADMRIVAYGALCLFKHLLR